MDISTLLNTRSKTGTTTEATQRALDNQDRFLTLLVAQMKNQDPMNPMENAQLTTQIAQIQTVTGVDQLNTGIEKLGLQFGQSQMMNAVNLVGRTVVLPGDRMNTTVEQAIGEFELGSTASSVKVEVTTSAGRVLETVDLGPLQAGRQTFTWRGEGFEPGRELHFRVKATKGTAEVPATHYQRELVTAISNKDGKVQAELLSGGRADLTSIVSVV